MRPVIWRSITLAGMSSLQACQLCPRCVAAAKVLSPPVPRDYACRSQQRRSSRRAVRLAATSHDRFMRGFSGLPIRSHGQDTNALSRPLAASLCGLLWISGKHPSRITRPDSCPLRFPFPLRLPRCNERAAVCPDAAVQSREAGQSARPQDGFPKKPRARSVILPRPARHT